MFDKAKRWEGTGQSSHLPDAVDVLVVPESQSIEADDGSVESPEDSCPALAAQPPSPLPIQASVVEVAIQTDLSFFLAANKDTQYAECANYPAMPARSLCPLVSIPLKSPLAILQPKLLAVQRPPSVPQGCVTTAAGVFVADTKCGAPAELEPVVPEDADLGLIKDTVDTEGNQTSCDQQQLRSRQRPPIPIQCLCPMLHHVGRAMPKIYLAVSSWLTPQSLNQRLQRRWAQAVRLSCLTQCHLPHPSLLFLSCCLPSGHRR